MPPRKKVATLPGPPPTVTTTIPLHCLLCPKKPTFSDVSHLLTHISSKSHLHHRFKTEIRSHKDRDARDTLQDFDTWYVRYNIQDLLSDRMDAKDKKNGTKRSREESPEAKPRNYRKKEKPIKPDPESPPRWSSRASLHAHSSRQDSDYEDDVAYRAPVTRRSQRLRLAQSNLSRVVHSMESPSDEDAPEDTTVHEEEPTAEAREDTAEIAAADVLSVKSKLKGVLWPGMSLFDSATEEQKRKRNQRKDAGVLRNMQHVAASVAPFETVWTSIGDFQRIRDIYATPSPCGTPEPEDEQNAEPKKKRARRSTAAFKTAPARKKRASTRATEYKTEVKHEDDDDSILLSEAMNPSIETTPIEDVSTSDSKAVSSSLTNSPDGEAAFDIFRDPPVSRPGQSGATLQTYFYSPYSSYDTLDPLLSSPELTWASGYTEGPPTGMNFCPSTRQALQPLNPNMTMDSPVADSLKHLPHLRRGHSELTSSNTSYYTQSHGLPLGNFGNPLAYTQDRSQSSFVNPFGGNANLEEDPKPPMGFQPVNMLHGIPFSSFPALNSGSHSYYSQPAPQQEEPREWKN